MNPDAAPNAAPNASPAPWNDMQAAERRLKELAGMSYPDRDGQKTT